MSRAGLASSLVNSDCSDWMLGFLPSSLSCSALWELSGWRRRPRWQLRETPAWPELRAQMAWKCVWVFSLARRCVCESRCYSDCTKASEYLITLRERDEEKREYNCWITGLYRPSLTNASSCYLILGRFVFVPFQYRYLVSLFSQCSIRETRFVWVRSLPHIAAYSGQELST